MEVILGNSDRRGGWVGERQGREGSQYKMFRIKQVHDDGTWRSTRVSWKSEEENRTVDESLLVVSAGRNKPGRVSRF